MSNEKIICDQEFERGTMLGIELTLSAFIAMAQALRFAVSHKQAFEDFTGCSICLSSVEQEEKVIANLITLAYQHRNEVYKGKLPPPKAVN